MEYQSLSRGHPSCLCAARIRYNFLGVMEISLFFPIMLNHCYIQSYEFGLGENTFLFYNTESKKPYKICCHRPFIHNVLNYFDFINNSLINKYQEKKNRALILSGWIQLFLECVSGSGFFEVWIPILFIMRFGSESGSS